MTEMEPKRREVRRGPASDGDESTNCSRGNILGCSVRYVCSSFGFLHAQHLTFVLGFYYHLHAGFCFILNQRIEIQPSHLFDALKGVVSLPFFATFLFTLAICPGVSSAP